MRCDGLDHSHQQAALSAHRLGPDRGPPPALSLATLALAPLYGLVPYLANRSAWGARLALPLVGLGDTLYATKAMGSGAGTELFLFPCALLAIIGFSAREATARRTLIIVIYCAAIALHGRYGAAFQAWSADDVTRLFSLNTFSVASLTAYIGLRFAQVE